MGFAPWAFLRLRFCYGVRAALPESEVPEVPARRIDGLRHRYPVPHLQVTHSRARYSTCPSPCCREQAMIRTLILLLCLPAVASAQKPNIVPKPTRGETMIANYFKAEVKQIADTCLTGPITKADWEKQRPELRKQFLEMVGLWPMPARTALKAKVTGTVEGEGFTVEKIHFESFPGLVVTANLYLPKSKKPNKNLPTILYVCGHGNVVENNISFGSKVHYQYHPAWFATHGYACLILDTLQLSEIPGIHHGTYKFGWWWWQARGYTPAGIELWNAMRALDYLETRPEVDAKRIGVTGRSGGGATSWWILAGDDRPICFAPIAGIADLHAQLNEGEAERLKTGVIAGHCDCMFMVNKYRWDFPLVAALAAPRPLLLGNSDADDIFPVAGYRRIAEKVRKVYAAYGAEEKFQLLETKGPHKDTPELRIGINKWMQRWLKNDTKTSIEDDLPPKLLPQQLKVLAAIPEGTINDRLHDVFIKPVQIVLPKSDEVAKTWWPQKSKELMSQLEKQCFAGWPQNAAAVPFQPAKERTTHGLRVREYAFTSQKEIELPLFVLSAEKVDPKEILLVVLNEEEWQQLNDKLALLPSVEKQKPDAAFAKELSGLLGEKKRAMAYLAPRGIGPTAWAKPGSSLDIQHRRRFALIGQTLDSMRVWDTRRAVQLLQALPAFTKLPLELHGTGTMAGIALYAGLFEPSVTSFYLNELSASHEAPAGPVFLNVSKVLDLPQAVALAAPRKVVLKLNNLADDGKQWLWPITLQQHLGTKSLEVR